MSVLTDLSEAAGSFPGSAMDKSSFSQTCSLLSQHLEGRRNFGDVNRGVTSNSEEKGNSVVTDFRNLLPSLETSGIVFALNTIMDLFPGAGDATQVASVDTDFRPVMEPQTAQMTIFYAGQVLVLDKLSGEKAKEIMLLGKAPSSTPNCFPSTSGNDQNHPTGLVPSTLNFISTSSQEHPLRPNASDLPIERKASLHRFLEKRKDRLGAKAPYQLNNAFSVDKKPAKSNKTWLRLFSESTKGFNFQL